MTWYVVKVTNGLNPYDPDYQECNLARFEDEAKAERYMKHHHREAFDRLSKGESLEDIYGIARKRKPNYENEKGSYEAEPEFKARYRIQKYVIVE